jgi:hypothetical protein
MFQTQVWNNVGHSTVLGGGTVTKQALQNRPYGGPYLRRITYAISRTLFLENTIHSTVLIGSTWSYINTARRADGFGVPISWRCLPPVLLKWLRSIDGVCGRGLFSGCLCFIRTRTCGVNGKETETYGRWYVQHSTAGERRSWIFI